MFKALKNKLINFRKSKILSNVAYNIFFSVPTTKWTAFNYGYAPVSEAVKRDKTGKDQPFQIELYNQVLQAIDLPMTAQTLLCEISSGRGAGLDFIARNTSMKTMGLERALTGRLFSLLWYKQPLKKVNAPTLPLADASVDIFISIEAAHNYFGKAFAEEIHRCLKPGGILVISDCPLGPYDKHQILITQTLEEAGLELTSYRNITPNAIDALKQDNERKEKMIRWVPEKLKPEIRQTLACDPSERLDSFLEERRGYYLLRATKAPQAPNDNID